LQFLPHIFFRLRLLFFPSDSDDNYGDQDDDDDEPDDSAAATPVMPQRTHADFLANATTPKERRIANNASLKYQRSFLNPPPTPPLITATIPHREAVMDLVAVGSPLGS
jgi:hypothetical protein